MFTNTPPTLACPAGCRTVKRTCTYFYYRQDSLINTAQLPPKLYINTWQWLPTLYTKTLTQNGRLYLYYPRRRALENPASQIEGPQEAKKREHDLGLPNGCSYLALKKE